MWSVAVLLYAIAAFGLTPDVERHFLAAQQAQAEKDFATAEREYKEVLRLDPRFAEAHLNLGLIYQMDGRIPQAMDEFHSALKLKPNLAGANFFLAIDYAKRGDGAAAVPYLEATAEQQAHNIEVLFLLGQAYQRLGKAEVAALKKMLPDSVRGEQLVAESYATSNDWPSAVIHFQNALAKGPALSGLHLELGEVYLHAGKIKQAQAEFEQELRQNPASVRSRVRLGEAKLFDEDTKGALEDWSQALAVDPPQVERVLGISEGTLGDSASEQFPDEMEKRLDAAAEQLNGDASPAAQLARAFISQQKGVAPEYRNATLPTECSGNTALLLKQEKYSALRACVDRVPPAMRLDVVSALFSVGEYDAALRLLHGLPAAQKASPDARYWLARSYEKLATAAYVRLYQADPHSYRVHELLGDLAATRDDDAKAIEEYHAAIALNPAAPNLHYKLGHIFWKNTKVPDAREQFEQELKAKPNHAGSLHEMGETYLLEHQPDLALQYLKRALDSDPGDPDIHRDLGTAYTQLDQYAKAEPEFKLAIASDHDGSVHYKLAKVYQALGQKANADREFSIYRSMNRNAHEKLEQQGQRLSDISLAQQPPPDKFALYHLARVDIEDRQIDRAVRRFESLGENFDIALAYLYAGRYQESANMARSLPPSPDTSTVLGVAEAKLGDEHAAVTALQKAAEADPKREEHWLNLSCELMGTSHYAEARAAVQAGLQANPQSYALNLRLGAVDLALADYSSAEKIFRDMAQAGDPLPTSSVGLAQVLLRTGRADEAVTLLSDEEKRLGPQFLIIYFKALALDRSGDRESALATFRRAVDANPGSAEAHFGVGRLRLASGQAREAATEFETVLRLQPGNTAARRLLRVAYARARDKNATLPPDAQTDGEPPSLIGDFILPDWRPPQSER